MIWCIQLYSNQGSAESWGYEHPTWQELGCKQKGEKMFATAWVFSSFALFISITNTWTLKNGFVHLSELLPILFTGLLLTWLSGSTSSLFPLRSYKIGKTNQLAELQRHSCAIVPLHILQINHLLNICITSVFWIGCIVPMLGTY